MKEKLEYLIASVDFNSELSVIILGAGYLLAIVALLVSLN